MNSAETLLTVDRCPRSAYWGKAWQKPAIHPNELLRKAIDAGLMAEESDPGQYAGDTVMTLAAERTIDVDGSQYSCAVHNAALADVIVSAIRGSGASWGRPADKPGKTSIWVSSCFLEPSGVRLRRVLCVDRWSEERFKSEIHSWKGLGEVCAYEMPMTMTIVLVGQSREGKHHSPWSKGWLHPRSRNLRLRKRSGEGFGGEWKSCWREEVDHISRDKWLDQMREDGVFADCLFEKEIPVPIPEVVAKVRTLAERKLYKLYNISETPDPNPSVCDWPTPCQFRVCCWTFTEPSERNGFLPLSGLVSTLPSVLPGTKR